MVDWKLKVKIKETMVIRGQNYFRLVVKGRNIFPSRIVLPEIPLKGLDNQMGG
jgi:hypothetical protein